MYNADECNLLLLGRASKDTRSKPSYRTFYPADKKPGLVAGWVLR